MFDQNPALEEQLREAAWRIRIVREDLLKTAESLSSPHREQVWQAAGELMNFCAELQEIADHATTGEITTSKVANLRVRIESAIRDSLKVTIKSLRELAGEPDQREEQASERVN